MFSMCITPCICVVYIYFECYLNLLSAKLTGNVEEIISLYRVLGYNRDMFALRYPLNINYRSFETLVM